MVSTTFSGRQAGQTTRSWATTRPIPSLRFLAMLLALLTSVLLVDAMIEPLAPFDLWAINLIQRIDLPYLGTIIRPFDALISSLGAIATWALLLIACVAGRKWLPALAVMMLPIGGLINNVVSEVLVGRTRPHGYDQILRTVNDIEAASFPSGHTMGAVLLYGLIFFLAREFRSDKLRLAVQVGAIAVIGIVGFGRVWYGAHWPSDVLGAYALGGLMLVGIISLYLKIEAAVGDIPFIRAATVAHDENRPHAHALTSTVFFNEGGTVSKVYAPGFLPRAIYWLAY